MIADRSTFAAKRRAGFGLIEMAVTGALIAVAMTVTVQVVGWIALERKAVERRERAVLAANNLLERLVAQPYDELTTESAGKLRLPASTASFLRSPTLEMTVTPFDDAPTRKRIKVELRWLDRSGRAESAVRLVAWNFRKGEEPR